MRNLRERLKAVTSASTAPKPVPKENAEPFFCREHIVPLEELLGVEHTKLDDILAVDPLFTGKSWDIRRVLFLDTETTGLSGGAGTIAFEIGLGYIETRGMVIRQYVMRDYSEEAAMLSEIASLFQRFDTVVSFNGKTFDLPLLESRMVMARIRMPVTRMPHLDLLHAARRVYKLRLRRCNLASLEEEVLGQHREDDLPGAQVPQRYFDYIRTHEFALLEDVLRHNLDDVKSLAKLTGHLCTAFREPECLVHPEDVFGVGKTLMRSGRIHRARSCFRIVGRSSIAADAHMYLAASYKKEHDWDAVVLSCQDMISRGEGGVWPYIELSKYFEHIARDIPRALHYAAGALQYSLNMSPIVVSNDEQELQIRRRISRLQIKQKKLCDKHLQEE